MINRSAWRTASPLFLSTLLLISACNQAPSRYDQVQQETTDRKAPPAVAQDATRGGTFNPFFPRSVSGYEIVPAQEKRGFAEYKVNQGGKTVAMLAISDTSGTDAATKFQSSTQKIAGYPAVQQGQNATAILVNNRYQVKVLSRDPAFTAADRAAWIEKFDLRGLANL